MHTQRKVLVTWFAMVAVCLAIFAWVFTAPVEAWICQPNLGGQCQMGVFGYCCPATNTVCKNHTCRRLFP